MQKVTDAGVLEPILNADWPWSGFAIGDLEPEWMAYCDWWRSGDTVVLVFHGLTPPLLSVYGDTSQVSGMLECIHEPRIWANVPPACEDTFGRFYEPGKVVRMRRMYREGPAPLPSAGGAVRLTLSDRFEIESLLKQGEWVLFLPQALGSGHFYGVRDPEGCLIALAGTHLATVRYNMAALGSVFTHPAHRGRGLARLCCSYVLASIARAGITRAVLNVEEEKPAARRIYEGLGFNTACVYLDGEYTRMPREGTQTLPANPIDS